MCLWNGYKNTKSDMTAQLSGLYLQDYMNLIIFGNFVTKGL